MSSIIIITIAIFDGISGCGLADMPPYQVSTEGSHKEHCYDVITWPL